MTNKEQHELFMQKFFENILKLTKEKNKDYTGIGDDPYHNLRLCEHANIASTLQGLLVRMTDKLARLNSFAQRGELSVKNESVIDTLSDLAGYAGITASFINYESKKEMVWGSPEVVIDYAKPEPIPSEFSQKTDPKL